MGRRSPQTVRRYVEVKHSNICSTTTTCCFTGICCSGTAARAGHGCAFLARADRRNIRPRHAAGRDRDGHEAARQRRLRRGRRCSSHLFVSSRDRREHSSDSRRASRRPRAEIIKVAHNYRSVRPHPPCCLYALMSGSAREPYQKKKGNCAFRHVRRRPWVHVLCLGQADQSAVVVMSSSKSLPHARQGCALQAGQPVLYTQHSSAYVPRAAS